MELRMDGEPTLRQLRYFAALIEAGHYGRAAARLGVSQPSLSQQIAALERTLGMVLVERGRGGALPTPAGRDVLERARAILDEVEGLRDLARSHGAGAGGTIRLGSTTTLGPYILPSVVRRLPQDHPGLRLFVRDGSPSSLIEDLGAGRLDLVLTQLPVADKGMIVERLFREPLSLAVASGHPLAGRGTVRDADLAGLEVLSLGPAYVLHGQIRDFCEEVGARLRPDYEGTSLDALRQMVAMNLGATFLPALYARSEIVGRGDDVALVPLPRGRLTRSVGLVARASSGRRSGIGRLAGTIRNVVAAEFAGLVTME